LLPEGADGASAAATLLSFSTFGSSQVPVMPYSKENICPRGSFSTRWLRKVTIPATGLITPTSVAAESPSFGVTRTCRSCVSRARSVLPCITTSAAEPRILKSRLSSTPRAICAVASMRSHLNPLENTSRKSSAMRWGSICKLISDTSLPMPGSISRNWPSAACTSSRPVRLA
jgi:hypothetical protein